MTGMLMMSTSGARPLRYGSRSTDPAAQRIEALRSRIAARQRREVHDEKVRRAAVLVPIIAADERLELLCFERTHEVLEHKGEICLPGGSIEKEDRDPVDAALREAREELGIDPEGVEVLGLLDDVNTTVSNYAITPVVGFIAAPPDIVTDPLEVARPIVVGLDVLLTRGVESYELRAPNGTWRTIYAYTIGDDRIWGATARIIHQMLTIWFGEDRAPA